MNNPNSDILLTEDGHPIGDLVIADNTALPNELPESVKEADREEYRKAMAMEITGKIDADPSVAELYPFYMDADKRNHAMRLYVVEQKSLGEVATTIGVPERTVSAWAYDNRWDGMARKELEVRQAASLLDLANLRIERRAKLARKQLDQADKLRDKAAEDVLSGKISAKSGTEAWAAVAKVEQTIVGMSEAGTIASLDGKDESKCDSGKGKTPLVMVFNGGGLPPVRRCQ